MALLTTRQEYDAVREAIQYLTTLGPDAKPHPFSVQMDGMSVTYGPSVTINYLRERENELANRLCSRNVRKRVTPDFSGNGGQY